MAICRLCLKNKELIKKSHIIPEFMYRDLFDENHKIHVFNPAELATENPKVKRPSSGEYEGNILCADCDNKVIGGYEDYACKAIYGGPLHADESPICQNYQTQDGLEFSACENINYKKFKLFLLSILWRASISTRPLFNQISLGPHEEVIRQMVYGGNPGDASDYPVFMLTYITDKSIPKDLIGHPQKRKTKTGHLTNCFVIAGTVYVFYTNSKTHKLPDFVLSSTIRPSNELNIFHIPKGEGENLILSFCGFKPTR
jgi:hypothetical protein